MNDFQLKIILSILGGIVFSFVFILLAFTLPVKKETKTLIKKPQNALEKVSHSARKK
ncbi:MAG: hypothetical protein U9N33_08395 [Campylobacterota bacterium]|nr:hypothetical protein [Campylobacterota bacterium]